MISLANNLLAGFDIVLELSKQTVLDLIQNQQLGTIPSPIPPFELTIQNMSFPGALSGEIVQANIIVDEMTLDLNADDSIYINMHFDNSSVIGQGLSLLPISPLDGNITITIPGLTIDNGQITADLSNAVTAIAFSTTAQGIISTALNNLMKLSDFESSSQTALQMYVNKNIGKVTLPASFNIVPGQDGALIPALQFEKLECHNIGGQALGLFGVLIAANDGNGDHTQKTQTAITAGSDFCASISPQVFHSQIFCPLLAQNLTTLFGTSVITTDLPTSCGSAASLTIPPNVVSSDFAKGNGTATFDNISDMFDDSGFIDISISLSATSQCVKGPSAAEKEFGSYSVSASVEGEISFFFTPTTDNDGNVIAQSLDASVNFPPSQIKSQITGGTGICGLLLAFWPSFNPSLQSMLTSAVADMVKTIQGINGVFPNVSSSFAPELGSWNMVTIISEGLTFNGVASYLQNAIFNKQSNASKPGLQVATDDSSVEVGQSSGSITIANTGSIYLRCLSGTYPYRSTMCQVTHGFLLTGNLLCEPLTFSATINGIPIPQLGNGGTLSVPNSIGAGGGSPPSNVTVDYTTSSDLFSYYAISLTNHNPKEGNFIVYLSVKATDPNGIVHEFDANVGFFCNFTSYGGGFKAKSQECMQQAIEDLVAASHIAGLIPPVSLVLLLPADALKGVDPELLGFIETVVSSRAPNVTSILELSSLIYGTEFDKAVYSGIQTAFVANSSRLTTTRRGTIRTTISASRPLQEGE